MSEPFVGEIKMFGGNFAPRGWAFCDGQLLTISSNDALFSLLGTTYGGDGRTSFGLPDLRGRLPIHAGTGPGLAPRRLGDKGGEENNTLAIANFPTHSHAPQAIADTGTSSSPQDAVWAMSGELFYTTGTGDDGNMASDALLPSGGGSGQSHANLMPALAVNFIVALVGVYPSQN